MSNKNAFLRMLGKFSRKKPEPDRPASLRRTAAESEFDEFTSPWSRQTEVPLNLRSIRRVFRDADDGAPGELAGLFARLQEYDPNMGAHLQTRFLSVLACDWRVEGVDPERAAEAEKILIRAGIRRLLTHLLGALVHGYAGAAIIWGDGGGSIRSFRLISPVNFVFDKLGNPALLTYDGKEKALASYHENQFVFIRHESPLLRPLVWLFFFKYYAMRDRARYLERFGIPFIAAKIRNEDFESGEIRAELMRSLAKLGSDGVGLLNEGAEIQIMNSGGSASADYQSWLDYLDTLSTRLILGQTATSSGGTGFSNGSVQENVRRDLIEADCRLLMESVQRAVLDPLERYKWGTEGTLQFKLDYSGSDDLVSKARMVEQLSNAGVKIAPDWIEKTFNVRLDKTINQEKRG